jgi:hypothetical protein
MKLASLAYSNTQLKQLAGYGYPKNELFQVKGKLLVLLIYCHLGPPV